MTAAVERVRQAHDSVPRRIACLVTLRPLQLSQVHAAKFVDDEIDLSKYDVPH